MKPFDQLTQRGQTARLLALAKVTMRAYPIETQRVRLLAKHTNTLFRVDASDGARYLLRVCASGEHSLRDHQIEAMWLAALGQTDIPVPCLIANRDGQLITQVATDGVPDGRRCMLFGWVPGKPMADASAIENYEKLGKLMARLHQHAATMCVSEDMQPMRWDKTFYFPHEPVVVFDADKAHLFGVGQVETIRRVASVVDAELGKLYAHGQPHLIHGDLHTDNVHVYKGKLYALDFEDVMWGFPAQDIGVSLYGARYHREDFAVVKNAFQRGYEQVSTWPIESDRQLEIVFIARALMFINYSVNQRHEAEMLAYLPRMLARVEAFEKHTMTD